MALAAYVQTAKKVLSRLLKWEVDPLFSRTQETLLAGSGADREVELGAVLGKVLFGTPVITPDGGNTGDGALGTLTLGTRAKVGDYVATCIAAAADAGTFQVVNPDGVLLPNATVGVAYTSSEINFTITDGAADWAAGDKVTVAVPAGSGKLTAIDFTKVDGTQRAYGVAAQGQTAPDGVDASLVVIRRQAVLVADELGWPDGATTAQKNGALAELAAQGVITATEV